MTVVDLWAGTISSCLEKLKEMSKEEGDVLRCAFNDSYILSSDTIDDAYLRIIGVTKAEHDAYCQKKREEHERREAEFRAKIPELEKEYKAKARGKVLDSELELWDKIVPIRLGDLYHGMELDQTLLVCSIMRDENLTYDERLHKAYKVFMDAGHSGMSAGLTASMIKRFSPDGADVADAVMHFRFDKTKEG